MDTGSGRNTVAMHDHDARDGGNGGVLPHEQVEVDHVVVNLQLRRARERCRTQRVVETKGAGIGDGLNEARTDPCRVE